MVIALRASARAGLAPRELRALRWQVLEVSWSHVVGEHPTGAEAVEANPMDPIVNLEMVLATIKEVAGLPGAVGIRDGKTWLRSLGPQGVKAASTLSWLSKLRNAAAHPRSAQLVAEIRQLAAEQSKQAMQQQSEFKDPGGMEGTASAASACVVSKAEEFHIGSEFGDHTEVHSDDVPVSTLAGSVVSMGDSSSEVGNAQSKVEKARIGAGATEEVAAAAEIASEADVRLARRLVDEVAGCSLQDALRELSKSGGLFHPARRALQCCIADLGS